jgi:hypothetical protein
MSHLKPKIDPFLYIVMIDKNCWLASGTGDPARTVVFDHAKRYLSDFAAAKALNNARSCRNLPNSHIFRLPNPQYKKWIDQAKQYKTLDFLRVSKLQNKPVNVWRVQCRCLHLYQPPTTPYALDYVTCPACKKTYVINYNNAILQYAARGQNTLLSIGYHHDRPTRPL